MVSPSSAFDQQHLVYTYPLIYYGSSKCGLIFSHEHRESRPGFGSWRLEFLTLTSCWTLKRKTFYLFGNTFLVQHALYTHMQKYKSSPRLLCFLFMTDGGPTT